MQSWSVAPHWFDQGVYFDSHSSICEFFWRVVLSFDKGRQFHQKLAKFHFAYTLALFTRNASFYLLGLGLLRDAILTTISLTTQIIRFACLSNSCAPSYRKESTIREGRLWFELYSTVKRNMNMFDMGRIQHASPWWLLLNTYDAKFILHVSQMVQYDKT